MDGVRKCTQFAAQRAVNCIPTQRVTAIKLSFVGAGRARDDGATTLQSLCKYRGRGPLLRSIDVLNLMAVTQRVGTRKTRKNEENRLLVGTQSRMPRRVPELSPGIAHRGAAGMQRVARGPGMALLATPGESEERRKQAATGSLFLWLLSFGDAKESNSPSGARTRFK